MSAGAPGGCWAAAACSIPPPSGTRTGSLNAIQRLLAPSTAQAFHSPSLAVAEACAEAWASVEHGAAVMLTPQ